MPQPELMHTGKTDKNSMSDLHETACHISEEAFKAHGGTPPFWIIGVPDGIVAIATPWADDREQLASRDMIAVMLYATKAHAYSFASECYSVSLGYKEGETAEQLAERRHRELPERFSMLPEEQRDEILLIHSMQRGAGSSQLVSRYMINSKRKHEGKLPFLGPRIEEDWGGGAKGRMTNLFDNPPINNPLVAALISRIFANFGEL